jgi:hypothetical protein
VGTVPPKLAENLVVLASFLVLEQEKEVETETSRRFEEILLGMAAGSNREIG